jgi:acetylornithine deacetylase/succinyl-diaminopimelate desuccinylase-like protein
MFIKASENFSHGLNERTPIANIAPAVDFYLSIVPDLSK